MSDFEKEDLELQAVMGAQFIDATKENATAYADTPTAVPTPKKRRVSVKNVPEKEIPADAVWEPVKAVPDFTAKLMQTVKDVGLYAVISSVVFWWQQSGRLDEKTAWYTLLFCVGMVFFAIGKNWRGWFE